MNAADKSRSPIYRQLDAYEETWKREHKEAIACRDWEDAIAVGINIFQMLREREQAWSDQVFRGVIAFSEGDNLDHRARFENWLETTKQVLREILPELEKLFGEVERAGELRNCAEYCERILRDWQPPRLSMAVGLRDQWLSPEAAAEFDRIMAEANTSPPTIPAGPIPKEISKEVFFAALKR